MQLQLHNSMLGRHRTVQRLDVPEFDKENGNDMRHQQYSASSFNLAPRSPINLPTAVPAMRQSVLGLARAAFRTPLSCPRHSLGRVRGVHYLRDIPLPSRYEMAR